MIKMISFAKRKQGMPVDEFQNYWISAHALKVKGYPGLRKYAVSLTLQSGYGRGEPAYDGVAELWFDDLNYFEKSRQSPEFAAEQIYIGLIKKKGFEIHFPKAFTFFLKFLRILPNSIYFKLVEMGYKK